MADTSGGYAQWVRHSATDSQIIGMRDERDRLRGRINEAADLGIRYGQIDGEHHKMWVIDQMLRTLLGENYERAIRESDPDEEYGWDTGIAP